MSSTAVPERAGRNDEAARVARLFERHVRMVYGVCRTMLRDAHEAEDATQQTFLSAHRALVGGARVRDEGAWLATIARNECRTRIAAGMRRPLSLGDDDLALIADPADELERRSHAEALRSAFADLPERQREAVVLRDLYGLRYGEVADALGLSRPATEALLFRARRALRQRLRPVVTTALVVPLSIQEGLAQALPGFAATGSGGVAAGVAGGGLLAKLTAGSVGVKVATAAVAATTVGAVGSVDPERAERERAERPAIVSSIRAPSADDVGSGSGDRGRTSSGGSARADDDGNSGSGSSETPVGNSGSDRQGENDDRDGAASVRGTGGGHDFTSVGSGSISSDSASGDDASSGPRSGGDDEAPDDSSGPSRPGSDDPPDFDDDSEDSRPDSSGRSASDGSSSGPGSGEADAGRDSSGSDHGGGGSSGPGSGDEPDDPDD